MSTSWPLVGRSESLRRIVTAANGSRAGVVLVGPPGVGRTRLARAGLDAVRGTDEAWHPFWAMAGRSTASVPLGAFGHLFSDLDSVAGGATTPRLLRAARQRLLDLAGNARPLIAVDDAHVLDETSAVLLQQMAASDEAFVLVTAPRGVPVPSPVFALWKEGLAERIDLADLDPAQTDRLVVHALCDGEPGTLVDGNTLARLRRLSGGNPLSLRELLDGGRAAGTLRRVGAVWRWAGPFPLTARLTELVDAQTGELSDGERDLMRLLAFGQPLDSEIATALVGREALASAERRSLLRSARNGHRVDLRVTRPLHAEVLRGSTTPLQERELYRRLSETAAAVASDRDATAVHSPEHGRTVAWRVAGGLPADTRGLLDAVDAVDTDDQGLAARLLALAAERDADPDLRWRLARTMIRCGRYERAETVLAELDRGADRDGRTTGVRRADVALVRAFNLVWGLRATDRARVVLDDAWADGTDAADPGPAAQRGFRALLDGRAADAIDIAGPAAADPDAGLGILAVLATACAADGRYARTVELAARAEVDGSDGSSARSDDGAGGWLHVATRAAHWYALLHTGDLDEADLIAGPGLAEARGRGLDHRASMFATWLGITAARRGRPLTASRRLVQAAAAVPAARFSFTVPLLTELAMALVVTGRVDRAERTLVESERMAGDEAGWTYAPRVLIAGMRGRTTQAADVALAASDDAGCARCHRMQALHTAVRLGITGTVAERLAGLAADAEGPLERAYVEHARALAGRDGDGLDRVADRFARLGTELTAAEAAAQAAHAHRVAGRPGPATASAARSRAWAARCEGARTPALSLVDGTADGAAALTPREHEIASLAAGGLSSRAIAGELSVSVRTVDNLLRSVYAKLGVAGRGDLVQVAGLRPS